MDKQIFVSPWNFETAMPDLPKDVEFKGDVREIEQAANVSLRIDDKIVLIKALQDIGIKDVDIGYPYRSKVDAEMARRLVEEGISMTKTAQVVAFLPDWKAEIDAAVDAEVDHFSFMIRSSDIAFETQMKMTREQVLERIIEVIQYGKSRGVHILPDYTDTTRADPSFLETLLRVLVDAGGKSVEISDTAGCITPVGMRRLVSQVGRVIPVSLVHCHNDFGLAVANTLAAVEEGVRAVSTTVNGLGERAGNAPLDEVACALEFLYGVNTGIRTEKLYDLARLVERLTKAPLYPWKPLVGEHAFTHKVDSHVFGVLQYPPNYEAINPELVGNRRKISIGKYSGKYATRWKLQQLGLTATDQEVREMIILIEQQAYEKKSDLTDKEFIRIFKLMRR